MFHSRTQHADKHVSAFDFANTYLAKDYCQKTNHASDDGVIQFRPNKKNGDESGVCSPPLWSKSPPRNPQESHKKIKNSPPLRVQAIVRGQVELMEMVKTMPESLYELSLKDFADHQKVGNQVADQEYGSTYIKKQVTSSNLKKQGSIRKQGSKKKAEKKTGTLVRTGNNINAENYNINNNKGLFLNMVFPMPFGGNKKVSKSKAKAKTKENPFAKASTEVVVGKSLSCKSDGKIVNDQKEWWRRRHSVASDDSESAGLSSSSGSSGSNDSSGSSHSNQSCRKKSGLLRGCSPFHSSKNNTEE